MRELFLQEAQRLGIEVRWTSKNMNNLMRHITPTRRRDTSLHDTTERPGLQQSAHF